ncbi:MAG: response regulator [Pyrinomonadaceae bacterium]
MLDLGRRRTDVPPLRADVRPGVRPGVRLGGRPSRAEYAFRLLEERPADIRVSDKRMPKIEGMQFLRRVSELYPQNFRILVTGHATIAGTLSELSSGIAQQFISKPWEEAAMRDALTRAQMAVRGGTIKALSPSLPSRK